MQPKSPLRIAARALLSAAASFALEEAHFYDPFKTYAAQTRLQKKTNRREKEGKCGRDGGRTQNFSLPFSILQVMV